MTSSGAPRVRDITDSLSLLVRFGALCARVLGRALTRVRIEGEVDAIPRTGGVIVAANHASNLDAVVIGGWLTPRLGRRFQWLAKREFFDWPVLGALAPAGGLHPVDRDKADLDAYRQAKRILDEGHLLFIFPEGTRSPDGRLQRAADGAAALALRTDAVIVPIGVIGADRVWPRGRKLPRPGGRVIVRVGRPFRLSELVQPSRGRTSKQAATAVLMGRIAELLPPAMRGAYAEAVPGGEDPALG
ncbi:MAG TPA: lysophospholipid acyltransferase family protein [Candidatus Limnocylindrales bacterium]